MSTASDQPTEPLLASLAEEAPPPAPPARRGRALVAWAVILAAVGLVVGLSQLRSDIASTDEADDGAAVVYEIQARYCVGAARSLPLPEIDWYEQFKQLDAGPAAQRLRFAVVAGELAGPQTALAHLEKLEAALQHDGLELAADDAAIRDVLSRLYQDYDRGDFLATSVTLAQREQLVVELGWAGELALAPANGLRDSQRQELLSGARRLFALVLSGFVGLSLLGLAGLTGLVLLLIRLLAGKGRVDLQQTGHGGIYAETFAVWIVLYVGLSIAAAFMSEEVPDLAAALVAMAGSLAALAWPRLRGVPWTAIQRDVGLYVGRDVLVEALSGLAAWVMAIPIVAAGVLVTLLLLELLASGEGPGPMPSHPIVPMVKDAPWWQIVLALVVASVAAPLVEETMFRGVLYRHLREATAARGTALSILVGVLVNTVVFAAVHPQGLVAVPALASVGAGLTLAREWRGSLVAPMVAHGFHNGLLMTVVLVALG